LNDEVQQKGSIVTKKVVKRGTRTVGGTYARFVLRVQVSGPILESDNFATLFSEALDGLGPLLARANMKLTSYVAGELAHRAHSTRPGETPAPSAVLARRELPIIKHDVLERGGNVFSVTVVAHVPDSGIPEYVAAAILSEEFSETSARLAAQLCGDAAAMAARYSDRRGASLVQMLGGSLHSEEDPDDPGHRVGPYL